MCTKCLPSIIAVDGKSDLHCVKVGVVCRLPLLHCSCRSKPGFSAFNPFSMSCFIVALVCSELQEKIGDIREELRSYQNEEENEEEKKRANEVLKRIDGWSMFNDIHEVLSREFAQFYLLT